MFKKCAAFILVILMPVFSLAGCQNSSLDSNKDMLPTTSQTEGSREEEINTTHTVDVTAQEVTTTQEQNTNDTSVVITTADTKTTTVFAKTTTTKQKTTNTSAITTTVQTTTTASQKTTTTAALPPKAYKLTPLPASAYYGRSQLAGMDNSAALLSAYQDIVSGVQAMKEEIELTVPLTKQEVMKVFYYYHDDYPQHFWCDSAFQYMLEGSSVTSILPQYAMTKAQKESAQSEFEAAVSACLKEASFGKNDYEREKIIHDYLAKRITYRNGKNAHNAYGALVEKKAVCDGYSRAFQWLLYQAGIPALIAEGSSINPMTNGEEPHAWNVVKIGGEYYHVDLTWDDASSKEVMYAYFNMTTKQIEESHRISAENAYVLPHCTATAANYHVKNGTVITSYTVDSIVSLMQRTNGDLHVYVADKSENFIKWFETNVGAIAKKIGITGGYSYQTITLGNEVVLHIASK